MSNETFLSHSKNDLTISKMAFDNEIYTNSIYMLQQANEKLAKEILHRGGMFDIEGLKKFSHNAVKPFLSFMKSELKSSNKGIERIQQKTGLSKNQIFSHELQFNGDVFETVILNAETQINQKWENITQTELDKMFIEFDQILELLPDFEVPLEFIQTFPELIEKYFSGIYQLFLENEEFISYFKDDKTALILRDLLTCFVTFAIKSLKFFSMNIQLNLLLQPHNNESRYPSLEFQNCYSYDANHLLIKNYNKLHLYTELAIQNYEEALVIIENIKPIVLKLKEIKNKKTGEFISPV